MKSSETDSSPEQVSQLVNSMIQEDFLYVLARSVHLLLFESRKDTQAVFSYVLRWRPPNSTEEESPALSHVIDHRPEIVVELCRGYNYKESAMPCGAVLREILKSEHVTAIVLYDQSQGNEPTVRVDDINLEEEIPQSGDGVFWKFFTWIDTGAFEVSADAFTTFRVSFVTFSHVVGEVNLLDLGHPHETQGLRVPISESKFRPLL